MEKDGAAYSYDAAGNLVHGPGWDYRYDAFNRLVQAKGKVQVDYAYDGNSMLRQTKKTQIVRHGLLPVQERFATGLARDLAWGLSLGGGIGGLLTARVGTTRTYYVYDGRGNVVAVLDATGNKVAEYAYDPYGAPAAASGSTDQPYRYSTKMYDADTGLYYFGYRFYSPALGRWINRDPLGVRGGLNLYAYALNNPLRYVDPNGLEPGLFTFDDETKRRQSDAFRREEEALRPIREAYDNWWDNRPREFRPWGPVSNARRFFGDSSAPVCQQYAEAAAEGINDRVGYGAAEPRWSWDVGKGLDNPMPVGAAHENVRVRGPDGSEIGTFDPWWRLW